ncbi:MAG: DUF2080 family transposase-associated protein [bacterium]
MDEKIKNELDLFPNGIVNVKQTKLFKPKEILYREVRKFGGSGALYLPKRYVGKKAIICLFDE